ncbi:hypothetical protein JTE90_000964 [Oedothorax gibbosus]|uniref:Uncharacterized protein n=1 Tax=Oedothorax gibbosus TaxID=931172 RepID=A0AAV6TQE0_9ARAC|nr:hypothetical protein JTE90_000964 [Oedothorax gibbosus]
MGDTLTDNSVLPWFCVEFVISEGPDHHSVETQSSPTSKPREIRSAGLFGDETWNQGEGYRTIRVQSDASATMDWFHSLHHSSDQLCEQQATRQLQPRNGNSLQRRHTTLTSNKSSLTGLLNIEHGAYATEQANPSKITWSVEDCSIHR